MPDTVDPHTSTQPSPPAGGTRLHACRQVVDSLVCLALAVILFRAFEVEGYLISTGSMAPSLLGLHKRVTCPICRFQFALGVSRHEAGAVPGWTPVVERASRHQRILAVCPNCGQQSLNTSRVPVNQGDQLLVHKHAYLYRPPRRWEVVVFRNPQQLAQAYVKRVVGLPGESLQIVDGDVYVGGRLQRKNLAEQRAIRIPVYDHDYEPDDADWQPRWLPEPADVMWKPFGWEPHDGKPGGNGFAFEAGADTLSPFESPLSWVTYRHWVRSGGGHVAPITDVYGYNRGGRGGSPVLVDDLMFSAQVGFQRGRGEFVLQMTDGRDVFDCVFDAAKSEIRLRINGGGEPVRTARLPMTTAEKPLLVEMSLMDRQVLVAVDGRSLFTPWKLSPLTEAGHPWPRHPVRFGAKDLQVYVQSLKLFRDVYYTSQKDYNGVDRPYKLGPDEYFVLGDNSPVSSDSRAWPNGGVSARLLLGKPFVVHLPSRPGRIRIGDSVAYIRIPDFARIRYIR